MASIVVITGAASGLGFSLSERFLARGDTVYGVTQTKRNWAEAKRRLVNAARFRLKSVDVSSERQVKSFLSKVYRETGRIDILINNAGYANPPVRTEKETLLEFQNNFTHNLLSTFLMCKYTLPIFQKQKEGWIINISSMAGKRAVPRLSAYSASKFGVVALTQSIAKENPEAGFRCIAVCPGGMNTRMRAKLFGREDASSQQSPDFVADKILEIISDRLTVPSGGDIAIRHGKVTAINPPPEP